MVRGTQRKDGFGCGTVAAEIVDYDGELAFARFPLDSSLLHSTWSFTRHDFISSAGTPACRSLK